MAVFDKIDLSNRLDRVETSGGWRKANDASTSCACTSVG
jgi:hypothetical protein